MTGPPPGPILDYRKPEDESNRRNSLAASEFSAKVLIVVLALLVLVIMILSFARGR